MPMSTITVAGINPGLNVLGATQQLNYNQQLSALQITNSFIPTLLINSAFNMEYRNNLFSGFRWIHSTASTDTHGSLTLQSFVNASFVGIDLISFTENDQINIIIPIILSNNLNLNGHKIINLADPTLAQDAATKNYVDTLTPGIVTLIGDVTGTGDVGTNINTFLANTPTARTNLGLTNIATQSVTQHSVLIGAASNAITSVALINGQLLIGSTGNDPVATTPTNGTNITWTTGTGSLTANLTGQVALANGGTNANLTASNGGIFYSTATSGAILSSTATANQVLLSGSNSAPIWSTATYPTTSTVNQILYSSATDTITGLATANNGILITSGGGIPSISTTLPTAVQGNITSVGTVTSGVWNGTTIVVPNGGTGITSTTAYAVLCGGTTSTSALQSVASLGSTGQVLTSQGAAALPIWTTNGSGTVTSITAGTGLSGGTITGSGTIAINNTAVTPGTYNGSFTVNPQGQLTDANNMFIGVLASLYMAGNATATSVTVANTFVKVMGVTTSGILVSFTMPSDNKLVYGGMPPITAMVSVDVSVIPNTLSSTLAITIYQNGSAISASAPNYNYQLTTGKPISLTVRIPVSFITSDYVEVFVTSDSINSVTVSNMNLSVTI